VVARHPPCPSEELGKGGFTRRVPKQYTWLGSNQPKIRGRGPTLLLLSAKRLYAFHGPTIRVRMFVEKDHPDTFCIRRGIRTRIASLVVPTVVVAALLYLVAPTQSVFRDEALPVGGLSLPDNSVCL
jgi:hypothetical protein